MITQTESRSDLQAAYSATCSSLGQRVGDNILPQDVWSLNQLAMLRVITTQRPDDVFAADAANLIDSTIGNQVSLVARRAREAEVLSNLAVSASLAGEMTDVVAHEAGSALVRLGMSPAVMRPPLDALEVLSRLGSSEGVLDTVMLVGDGRRELDVAFAGFRRVGDKARRRGINARLFTRLR